MHNIIKNDLIYLKKELQKFKPKMCNKTLLISGGAGFIGSWFCDLFSELGAKKIICVDNLSSGSKSNIEHLIEKKNFIFVKKDICKFNSREKLDYIIHMACIASPPIYQRYPIQTLDTSLMGTRKMLDLAQKNRVAGFLFTSTSEVYGNPENKYFPTKESYYGFVNSYGPRSMYDEGKRAAEAYCYAYALKFPDLHLRIARIFNTYGPRLDIKSKNFYGRALIKFISQAQHNKPITIYSDGLQTRAFCYITDQLQGLVKLLSLPKLDNKIINIGNPKEYSILKLANIIISVTRSKSKITFDTPPNYNLADDPRRRCPDIALAKKLLKFNPKISLEEGLQKTATWLKEQQ